MKLEPIQGTMTNARLYDREQDYVSAHCNAMADAREIALRYNAHDALVEAVERMIRWSVGENEYAEVIAGKRHAEHGETCALCTARAALALAKGGTR